jgi:phosphohistidine phosphatase
MHIYLVQHGEAVPEQENPARPLTDRGRMEVERVARLAAALALQAAEIRHSEKLRARQTAEILGEYLLPAGGIREVAGLAPLDDPAKTAAEVEAAPEPLMLVGHLPHLRRLTGSLLVGDPAREIVQFRMGAIVCLVKSEGGWQLQWILTPEIAGQRAWI